MPGLEKNLIVVVYKLEAGKEILRTIESLRPVENTKILFVLSQKSDYIHDFIQQNLKDYEVLIDLQSGIYYAMNLGIRYFNENKFNSLMFLNGGDEIYANVYNGASKNFTKGYMYSFRTHQKFLTKLYERPSRRASRIIKFAPHQGIVVCSCDEVPLYQTDNYSISSDVKWQVLLSKSLTVRFMDPILSKMYLGGISNRPSFKTCKIRASTDGYRRGVKEFLKLFLYSLLGAKRYYWLLSKKW